VKFQLQDRFAQVSSVEPKAARHVEFIFALAALAAERVDKVRCER